MDDQQRSDEGRPVSVQLDVYLDRQPVTGRLRTKQGADEEFVGWLGFIEALKHVHDVEDVARSSGPTRPTRKGAAND